jgi:hypothetical protein
MSDPLGASVVSQALPAGETLSELLIRHARDDQQLNVRMETFDNNRSHGFSFLKNRPMRSSEKGNVVLHLRLQAAEVIRMAWSVIPRFVIAPKPPGGSVFWWREFSSGSCVVLLKSFF